MISLPSTPQSPSQILSKGIEIGVNSFSRLFLFTTLVGFLALIPVLYLTVRIGNVTVTPEVLNSARNGTWYLIELVCLLCGILVQAVMLARLDDYVQRGTVNFGAELQRAAHVLLPLIVGSIILVFALIVGYVLLIVPGVILTVSLAFFQFCVVLDNQGPIAGLNRSHTLVWGNWWRTFAVLVLMLLIVIVIAVGLLTPIALLLGIHTGATTGRDMLIQGVMEMVGEALLTPFVLGVMYAQYHDLKLRQTHSAVA